MGRTELLLGELAIEGFSRAGDETWFRIHPPGLAFDAGRGARELAGAADLFLSHGHLDHALGVPYLLSQRSLHHLERTRIFCPQPTVAPLAALIAAAERLEGVTYRYELTGLAVGQRVEVGRDLTIEAFAIDHVVPGVGYHLFRRRRRLSPAYADRQPAELAALRAQGIDPSEVREELWLSYCGDTGPAVFDLEPRLFESKVLLIECTFLGAHRDAGDHYKHLHLEDFVRREEQFHNVAIVLHHLSRRHQVSELRAAIAERLPRLAPRVHLLVESTS